MKKLILTAILWYFFTAVVVLADPFFDPKLLEGKWEGTPPHGGRLEIEITLKDGKIDGLGHIKSGGKTSAYPKVTGTVSNNKVHLEIYFPRAGSTVHYNCDWKEIDLLTCKTPSGFENTFTRFNL